MQITRRNFVESLGACALGGVVGWPGLASAADWPERPMRLLSGGSAGGSSDLLARIVEEPVRQALGQPFVIVNMPGAGGSTAAVNASRATDGHTFFISNMASNVLAPLLVKGVNVDPKTTLPGVVRLCTLPNGLVVRTETGITSAGQLFNVIKSDASKRTYGSGGVGTSSHLACALLSQRLGVETVHVPYKGNADNLNGLLRGDVAFTIDNLPTLASNIKGGKLRLLAVTTTTRSPLFPDVPTLQESGLANFDAAGWFGFSAPASMPRASMERFANAVLKALADPAIQARYREAGAEPAPLALEAFSFWIEAETTKWGAVVKSAGLTAQ